MRGKYRGKRIDNGEWVYGNLIEDRYIVGDVIEWNEDYFNTEWWYTVVPETVSQHTGLTDSDGTEIYEGDICWVHTSIIAKPSYKAECIWDKYRFAFRAIDDSLLKGNKYLTPYINADPFGHVFEVIGNRWDTPELLNG